MTRLRFLIIRLIDKILGYWGYSVSYTPSATPTPFPESFLQQLATVEHEAPAKGFAVVTAYRDDSQPHPVKYIDYECSFATEQIRKYQPQTILDVGSYRHWLIGLMSHWHVTTLDVRERQSPLAYESVITADVLDMQLPPASFDMVISLSTIEHFGLGRYGDKFDLEADSKAIKKMLYVLRPGGYFVFSVPITGGQPYIAFNSHRVYQFDMIKAWLVDMKCLEEAYIRKDPAAFIPKTEITTELRDWASYCGCYQKL